jgi:hypothetical protein
LRRTSGLWKIFPRLQKRLLKGLVEEQGIEEAFEIEEELPASALKLNRSLSGKKLNDRLPEVLS